MKVILKRSLMIFSLIFVLILSLGFVSASDDSDFISDINFIDNPNENIISNSEGSNHGLDDNFENSNLILAGFDNSNIILNDSDSVDLNGYKDVSQKAKSADQRSGFNDIQSLIDNAQENDVIQLSGTYSGDSPIIVNKSLTLKSASGATLDGGFLTEIMIVSAPNVLLDHINFINGNYTALSITSNNVTLESCVFDNNINGELGCAVSVDGNYFNALNSNFTNNIANKSSCHHTDGAAINLNGNYANIRNCTFENNSGYNYETASSGGAIWMRGNYITVDNSRFINNSATAMFGWTLHGEEQTYLADGLGGSIYITGNRISILNCEFVDSLSHAWGGALYYKSAYDCLIYNSTFINSTSLGEGGVIYLGQNIYRLNIDSCKFINNTAEGMDGVLVKYTNNGSVIYSDKFTGDIKITNSSLMNNNGTSSIYFRGSNLNLSNSIISNDNLSAAVIFTNGSLKDNFWSSNFDSSDDFAKANLIIQNGENYIPETWINLKIDGLDSLDKKGDYEYDLSFVSNEGNVNMSLPDYNVNLRNTGNNIISPDSLILESSDGKFTYSFVESAMDTINVYDDYGKLILSKDVLSGVIPINDTGNDTKDLQDAIDNAEPGSLILLSDNVYVLDTISINKSIAISGNANTYIILSEGSDCLFNISNSNQGPDSVRISNINFILDNGDTAVVAESINSSNPFVIDVPHISIDNNNFTSINDDVIANSITILRLNSERSILAPNNDIVISNNSLESGMNPFEFNVIDISSGNDVRIPVGGNLQERQSSVIVCGDMYTKAVSSADPRTGEYFNVALKDSEGNVLANKPIKIGFNGKIYNKTTNASGEARLQINLPKKGTYTFAISFLGDDEYNASFEVVKIVVEAQVPKLTTSNVKFKLNAKSKTISASFKSMKGTAVSGKKISFTVNGKTYSTTTNSKGIASIKVSLNKKGTYKFTVKFLGDNTFAAVSKFTKVVIS